MFTRCLAWAEEIRCRSRLISLGPAVRWCTTGSIDNFRAQRPTERQQPHVWVVRTVTARLRRGLFKNGKNSAPDAPGSDVRKSRREFAKFDGGRPRVHDRAHLRRHELVVALDLF